ncbi:MAG TPA: histidinol dehydrogenase [Verrucomicrobiales bacterium]|nr:histidinol dehydrogenase [Verrucomicrobiales bacterium]
MKILSYDSPSFAAGLRKLDRRHVPTAELQAYVGGIIEEVRKRGDAAVVEFAAKFDGAALKAKGLGVTEKEMTEAQKGVKADVKRALAASHKNVLAFAKQSLRKNWKAKNAQGAEVGEVYQPFQRVGIYVPGGTAPLISTVIMTVTLAQAAGVPEIVVCTPCGPDGKVNAAMLAALKLAGATEVYRIGGAHAVAAMALGTKTIRPVDKILGPGNKFVVEAKRQLFGAVGIDLLPGPSEIMVLADESANPAFIAADLLAQAEHGKDSQVLLATPSMDLLKAVEVQIEHQLGTLPRAETARASLATGCWLVHTRDLQQGVEIANAWAPEHLSLVVNAKEEARLLPLVRTSGGIFVGDYSPVAAGDFLAGPSHTLPTGGAGKSFPGLTVDQFQRRTSIVKMSRKALLASAPVIEKFSEIEGLAAHGRSASLRALPG